MKKVILVLMMLFFVFCSIGVNAQEYELIRDDNLGRSLNLVKYDVNEKNFCTNLVFDYEKLYSMVSAKKIRISEGSTYDLCEDTLSEFVLKSTQRMNCSSELNIHLTESSKINASLDVFEEISNYYFQKYYKRYESKTNYQTYLENPLEVNNSIYSDCISNEFKQVVESAHNKYLNSNDYSGYYSIFDNFGTHILTKANYGCSVETYGMVYSNSYNLDSYLSSSFNTDIKEKLYSSGYEATLSGEFDLQIENQIINETGYFTNYYRGLNEASYYNWIKNHDKWDSAASKEENSVLIDDPSNSFMPIWSYLKWSDFADEIRNEFESAFTIYEQGINDYSKYDFKGKNFQIKKECNYKIHDTGRWEKENNKTFISFEQYLEKAQVLDSNAKIEINLSYSFKLVDDGYQYIFLYSSIDENSAELICSYELPGGSKKSSTEGAFNCEFNGSILIENGIGVLFGASGKFEDDWIIESFTLDVTLKKC